MHQALVQSSRAAATGIYLLGHQQFCLLWSTGAPDGFLESWASEIGVNDPLLLATMDEGRPMCGDSVYDRAVQKRILGTWGFASNMCGLLYVANAPRAVVFAASKDSDAFAQSHSLEWMALLCRAGSLALSRPGLPHNNSAYAPQLSDGPRKPAGTYAIASRSLATLPKRLKEVATLLCVGHSNKEIARTLGISDETVKDHVRRLCIRFSARNRTELVGILGALGADFRSLQQVNLRAGTLLSHVAWW